MTSPEHLQEAWEMLYCNQGGELMGILSNLVLILIIALVLFGVTLPVWYVLWLANKTGDWYKKATPEERRKMKKAVQISASMK